ncbi:MAG TPA: hypothetical protein VFR18_04630 [Terriglobia bacterium]|nr:hypothetical protein [Terriglobia bacterium]
MTQGNRFFIAFLVVGLIVASIFGFILVPKRAERWAVMQKRVNELRVEAQSRSLPRSVLHGAPIPGEAWGEYTIAINDAQTWTEDSKGMALGKFLNGDPSADRALVERMLVAHAGALDHFRRGAQRTNGQYPYRWQEGYLMELPSFGATRLLSRFAHAQSRMWAESGKTQEATDLLLDTLVFARDLGANGPLLSTMLGDAIYLMTFDELHHLLVSGKLTAKQLTYLEKKLAIVDHDFPSLIPAMANETLSLGISALDEFGAGTSFQEWTKIAVSGGWRYGFSPKRVALDAFDETESYSRRTQNATILGYGAARKEATAIQAESRSSDNPLFRQLIPDFPKSDLAHREVLARLRVLRAATGYLATGKLPSLEDPLGRDILTSQEGGKTRIWSLGMDGTDGGGVGGWPRVTNQQDIVIELPRRP